MRLKLSQLLRMQQPLRDLMQQKMTARAAFRMTRIARQVDQELHALEQQRRELIKRYGEEIEEGGYQVTAENMTAFQSEYQSLLDEEVDLDVSPIPVEMLEEAQITPASLSAIEPLLETGAWGELD